MYTCPPHVFLKFQYWLEHVSECGHMLSWIQFQFVFTFKIVSHGINIGFHMEPNVAANEANAESCICFLEHAINTTAHWQQF